MKTYVFAAFMLASMSAFASVDDNVTLVVENKAGAVTHFGGMTDRECEVAKAVLGSRRLTGNFTFNSGMVLNYGVPNGSFAVQPSSDLASVKCMRSTDAKP